MYIRVLCSYRVSPRLGSDLCVEWNSRKLLSEVEQINYLPEPYVETPNKGLPINTQFPVMMVVVVGNDWSHTGVEMQR